MSYRVKQFVWAVTAQVIEEERAFVNKYLTPEELQLFNQLKVYEQKHSIKVAQAMVGETEVDNQIESIRLGLLHDIGKIIYPIGPIRKSIMVLLHKFSKGRISRVRVSHMVKCYYEHPQLGYEILKGMNKYDVVFLQIIRDHHKDVYERKSGVQSLLKKWDDVF